MILQNIVKKYLDISKKLLIFASLNLITLKLWKQEIVKKLAELLYKDEGVYDGAVCFDWSSYDFDEDIPNLLIDPIRY